MSEVKRSTTENIKIVRQQKKNRRYIINIVVILLITFGYTTFSLWNDLPDVINVFRDSNANYRNLIGVALLIAARYFIEGLVLFIFARLYTNTYKLHRGVATGLVGQFFSDITPNSSGGQFFQVKTFAKQGIPVTISASILVMHFILYQIVLVSFGLIAILFNLSTLETLGSIPLFNINFPVWVLTIMGFVLNLITIVGLFLLSYSKKAHHFFINKGIDFLAAIRIVKNPESRKEKLQVSTENFRVELRRLNSNVPATVLIMVLFALKLLVTYSISYFVAITLNPDSANTLNYLSTVSQASFHSMITGLIPIPGAAGFAEYFFELIFAGVFGGDIAFTKAVQIVWRFSTFYTNLIVGGLVAAFYRSSMEELVDEGGNIKSFEDIKTETMVERRESSITMYQTSQLSIKEIQRRITPKKKRKEGDE